ncbi:class III lanthionine synthetase LanKC [Streptomyces sp. JJ38]|uniref:class III lanthionine synthetase LanKC n=1 Tax=Streptomyces sp. JJ38 TaxID=2738128 RepID=UPI001C5814B5|nr:class III lanthionine synthetase LanKC [Streptomyces sp. JJ38]MBW1596574.1 protein kinase/lanthionine synthetase C family protein [Streptomyces sp. JJ38]
MDLGRHLHFCPPGSPFFDVPARISPDEGNFALADADLPAGWSMQRDAEWIGVNPPDVELPPQGWKIHVSATLENAEEILGIASAYCLEHGLTFKFIRGLAVLEQRNGKYGDRSASGKFITVYPTDEARLERVLHELGELLDGREGPYILSDLRWRSGPLYVRYGGFVLRTVRGPSGTPVHCVEDPDGNLVPDHRGPGFRPPSWAPLPDCLTEALAARNAGTLHDFPYRVTGALHFSNGGGVYRGEDTRTGTPVLLREARPHAGLVDGRDAVYRQERERLALEKLADTEVVPALYDFRKGREHWFLVREFIEGEPLGREMIQRNPLARGSEDPQDFADYADWALGILDGVERGVDSLHARGIVFGDLHPSNILVRPDGGVGFIDFEAAAPVEEAERQTMGAAGFTAPDGVTGFAIDRYALGCLRLAVFNALTSLLPWGPRKTEDLIAAVTARFPVPEDFAHRVRADLGLTEHQTPTPWPSGEAAEMRAAWPELAAALGQGILECAETGRDDRLFPGDPDQFLTPEGTTAFAHGTAGVLWALAESGVPVPGQHIDRLVRDTRQLSDPRPDFFHGLAGIAYALDRLGRPREAAALLPHLDGEAAEGLGVSLMSGLSGIGLTLLHFARRTGDDLLLARARRLADRVRDTAPGEPGDASRFGLLRGPSGGALFLLRLFEETGDSALLDDAVTAARADLAALGWTGEEFPADAPGRMPLLGMGCAGTGMVLHDLLRHRPDAGLARARDAVAASAARQYLPQAGLFHGRSGTLLALHHLTGPSADGRPAPSALRHVRDHALQVVRLAPDGDDADAGPERVGVLGHDSLRISTDLATGGAGVLLALGAVLSDTPASLPFFSPAPRPDGAGSPGDVA